jgi:putative hydrolase
VKTWQKYPQHLASGQWHAHTHHTDGKNSVDEMCRKAIELGVPLLAFTEHVRRKLDYDFDQLLGEIEAARRAYAGQLTILTGCEAKVLPGGGLDVDPALLARVDYPIFSFHAFPKDVDLYVSSVSAAITNPHVNAWGHPGLFFLKHPELALDVDRLEPVFALMKQHSVILEINHRYRLPPEPWLQAYRKHGLPLANGGDLHSVGDFERSTVTATHPG